VAQPRFEFRLEGLLEHRRQLEKDQQRKVAEIQQEAQYMQRQIRDAQTRIVLENRKLTSQQLVGKLDMAYIAHEKRYVGNLHVQIAFMMQKLAGVEERIAAARVELLAAAKARKVIEKLREKQLARWRAEQDRKEAAAMDEIGTQIALRHMARESAAEAHA
jgi:flagellar FliJ protein